MTLRKTLLSVVVPLGLGAAMPAMAGELAYPCEDIATRAELSGFGTAVYQGDDGWFFRGNEISHEFPLSERGAMFLMRLDAVLKTHGVQLVLMPLPSKSMLAPAHGHPIEDPKARIDWYLQHRIEREAAIAAALKEAGTASIDDLSQRMSSNRSP